MNYSKIYVFGDSIAKGIISENGNLAITKNSAVKLYEKAFQVTIDNRSRFGQTLAKSYKRKVFDAFIAEISDKQKTAVVIELGGNDCIYYWKNVAIDPNGCHDPVTPLKDFIAYYEKVLKLFINAGIKVICCNLVPINSERYFNNVIGKTCDKNKVLEFFRGDYTTIYRHHEMFSNAITDTCRKLGVPVIDLRKPFLDSFEFSSCLCDDGIHPNERGQKLIFSSLCDFMQKAAV